MAMVPQYDLDKIKFATDSATFERAVGIYETGGVRHVSSDTHGTEARVRGSGGNVYAVSISHTHYDRGTCTCYLGKEDTLCKHMVAVAIYAIKQGELLTAGEKTLNSNPTASEIMGALSPTELKETKAAITVALRFIKGYDGPSRIWFAYQNSLMEGCNRLSAIISRLPVGEQSAETLVDLLLRLEKKVCEGGVDDSDGTVGDFMQGVVEMLKTYADLEPDCIRTFKKFEGLGDTSFGWEEPLVRLYNKSLTANTKRAATTRARRHP